jgi:hypothetical protein
MAASSCELSRLAFALPEKILLNSVVAKTSQTVLCLMLESYIFILVKYKFLCCLFARFI